MNNLSIKFKALIGLSLLTVGLGGCGKPENRSMDGMGVSRMSYEGCNYLVFKKSMDYGNAVVLDPKPQPTECGR